MFSVKLLHSSIFINLIYDEMIKWYKHRFYKVFIEFKFLKDSEAVLYKCKMFAFCVSDRLEKLNLRSVRSQAKVVGTIATVAGAMVITLVKGPVVELIWTKGKISHEQQSAVNLHHSITGALMITVGCFSWACFVVLQVKFFLINLHSSTH